MARRPSIQAAVARTREDETIVAGPPAEPPKRPAKERVSSREGKVPISAFFPPEVKASLRLVQAKRGGRLQDLIGEGLNLLFAKYGVPEAAPVASPKR